MKRFGSILLTLSVLFTLCTGALPVLAETAISVSSSRTVLVVGQEAQLTVTTTLSSYSLSSSDEGIVQVDNSTKKILAISKGTATITATGIDSSTGATVSSSVTIKVRTPTGIVSGKNYYIMNCGTGLLLSINGSSDISDVEVGGRVKNESVLSQWTATNVRTDGTGFTRLYHTASSTGLMMYALGSDLILRSTVSTNSRFAIHRIESGTNQGRYAIRYNNQYVAMNSSGDVYLTTSSSHNIYWSFMAVDKGYADLFSFNYNIDATGTNEAYTYNSTSNNSLFDNYIGTYYRAALLYTNPTVNTAYSRLAVDDIFIYRGHDGPATLSFQTTNNSVTGKLRAHINLKSTTASYSQYYISEYSDNALALQRCVLYLGCSTGVDQTRGGKSYNLLSLTFEKGAHFVLGTTQTTYVNNSDDFLEGFIHAVASGKSIEDCIEEALDNTGSQVPRPDLTSGVGKYPIIWVGDVTQYLN